ncbi:LysR substrate-binding domain-containing protein [Streptomyces sp. NPDC002896]|uniref:LysR family transcriptional regulator n=1 Tax=Streptomyces sp. NPDC002896 TaxID=3154438 RepID=UPI00331F901B
MELRQLAYFVAVTEEANFTRAAARLHVAQPGVSAQIRQLEAELGQPLLDRSGRTVRLTEVGEAVLPYARAALAAVEGARLAVEELTGLMRGHVTVGMMTSRAELGLPALLADFQQAHPAVEITLTADHSDRLLEALRTGRLDLAVVGLASPEAPPGVTIQVVVDAPLVAAVGHGHRLATKTTMPVAGLDEHALISLTRGTGLRTSLDQACAAAGFRPRIAFEAGDPNLLVELAGRGLGVAILPESLAAAHPDELHTVRLTDPALHSYLALAWRSADQGPVSPAARALIRRAREALRPSADR